MRSSPGSHRRSTLEPEDEIRAAVSLVDGELRIELSRRPLCAAVVERHESLHVRSVSAAVCRLEAGGDRCATDALRRALWRTVKIRRRTGESTLQCIFGPLMTTSAGAQGGRVCHAVECFQRPLEREMMSDHRLKPRNERRETRGARRDCTLREHTARLDPQRA